MTFTDQPDEKENFGGRVLVRMPVSLHRELVESARADGVSLNQFVCGLLASGVQWRRSAADNASAESRGRRQNSRVSDEEFSEIWRRAIG